MFNKKKEKKKTPQNDLHQVGGGVSYKKKNVDLSKGQAEVKIKI